MWGWSVSRETIFDMLDYYYAAGERYIDVATNYPINSRAQDYCKALELLSTWSNANGVDDLEVCFKFGSISNENTPENDLGDSAICKARDLAYKKLGGNIDCFMIHWDQRDVYSEIMHSLETTFSICKEMQWKLGVSGIENKNLYYKALSQLKFNELVLQAKSNILYKGELEYESLTDLPLQIWSYGISVSGLKLNQDDYRSDSYVSLVRDDNYHENLMTPKLRNKIIRLIESEEVIANFYQLSMLLADRNRKTYGYLISPSNLHQLENALNFRQKIDRSSLSLEEFIQNVE